MRVQFGEEYPRTPLLVELTSKTVPEKLLEGMVKVCDQEMQKHKGERQVCTQPHSQVTPDAPTRYTVGGHSLRNKMAWYPLFAHVWQSQYTCVKLFDSRMCS